MTSKLRRCEREIEKAIFDIAEKYGYTDLCVTGTINPKWYKYHLKHKQTPGLSVFFSESKVR